MTQPTPNRRERLLTAALDAAGRGWHVFPLRSGDKRPALHGEGACVRTGDCADGHLKWEQRASTSPGRIRYCWEFYPANIGIATGPSGLVVVDLDMPKSVKGNEGTPCGVTTFHALCERAGQEVPATYRTRTASGGQHLYFTAPPGVRLTNTAGRLGDLIDTRAWGGYVVGAGSTTPAGHYTVIDPAPVAPLPDWLCALLTPRQVSRALTAAPTPHRGSAYATAALRAETANVANAGEGVRNWTLLRAARALGRFVASGDLDRGEVQEALKGGGLAAGLLERECTPVITSALNWSITHNQGKAS
ncbi:bifunctional DNA primase/polymerase [Streptomyces sp. IB2014 016-6]|uniref:bifunctional DNA primase/polymerase n=1 Tax=Streptomyces sp. IB2014 016-6 TaxID=2517818 RepID=UPI0011CB25C8|nr:bifunctional DNA primase/polymerase [Streptomyces sp. IB2014 016-6]TXL86891.1 bifunctional DNA primase/polymerase [Streptomyces sp. IB2014 016-6]